MIIVETCYWWQASIKVWEKNAFAFSLHWFTCGCLYEENIGFYLCVWNWTCLYVHRMHVNISFFFYSNGHHHIYCPVWMRIAVYSLFLSFHYIHMVVSSRSHCIFSFSFCYWTNNKNQWWMDDICSIKGFMRNHSLIYISLSMRNERLHVPFFRMRISIQIAWSSKLDAEK